MINLLRGKFILKPTTELTECTKPEFKNMLAQKTELETQDSNFMQYVKYGLFVKNLDEME